MFCLGINLSPFLGPILTGLLQGERWLPLGFRPGSVGMAAGLIQYTLGRKTSRHTHPRCPTRCRGSGTR
jgi:POT family proton-dependent oligopeptide transporter